MKHKNLSTVTFALCSIILMGACIAEQIPLDDNQHSTENIKVQPVPTLDDAALSKAQTDPYALLSKQVQYIDSVYSLIISREEARILNIPDSIYDKFEHVIILLNNTKK